MSEVQSPHDPRLAQLADLLDRTFADPNTVLGLDRMQQFLAEGADAPRRFHVLVAEDPPHTVIGGSVFSYVAAANCGLSEYLLAEHAARGQGLGRALFDARRSILDAEARAHGQGRQLCEGLFIEVDSPVRAPAEMLAAERGSSMDAIERLRVFAHFGFKRVDVTYVQPPLAEDKEAVDYLDLLFAPWGAERDRVSTDMLVDTLGAIWSAWSADTAARALAELRHVLGGRTWLRLIDPLAGLEGA